MSFIAKNPLTMPEVESSPSVPQVGTRGLFAGKDGWYDIDSRGSVAKLIDSVSGGHGSALEEITLAQADSMLEGVYIVTDANSDWAEGTSESWLSKSLLLASKNTYSDGENYNQTLLLANGELWQRYLSTNKRSEWQSMIPSLSGYAKTEDVSAQIQSAIESERKNDFELIASGETTEEVNSIIISADNDGNPFELCDMVNIYAYCPKSSNSASAALAVNFDDYMLSQTSTSAINNAGNRYIGYRAVFTGAAWDVYNTQTDGSVAALNAGASRAYAAIREQLHRNSVKQIKLYIYNTAHKLPVGFEYYICGRRVKNANS